MFKFACPVGVHDQRVQSYLKNELDPPLSQFHGYEREVDDAREFVHYQFPGMDERKFTEISEFLNGTDGVTLIGVDSALTERKIMKLVDLLETPLEQFDENEEERKTIIAKLKVALKDKDGKLQADETSKFWGAIADIVGDFEDKNQTEIYQGFYNENKNTKKNKIRGLIRKTIRK